MTVGSLAGNTFTMENESTVFTTLDLPSGQRPGSYLGTRQQHYDLQANGRPHLR